MLERVGAPNCPFPYSTTAEPLSCTIHSCNITCTTSPTDFDLQCSYASVTLVDKPPPSYQEREPKAPASKDRNSATPAGYPSPPTSGANEKTNGGVATGGAAAGFSERGHGATENKRDGVDVPSRLKLALLGGVRVDKVVEKEALGTTARVAMAVSCAEVRVRCISNTRYLPALGSPLPRPYRQHDHERTRDGSASALLLSLPRRMLARLGWNCSIFVAPVGLMGAITARRSWHCGNTLDALATSRRSSVLVSLFFKPPTTFWTELPTK